MKEENYLNNIENNNETIESLETVSSNESTKEEKIENKNTEPPNTIDNKKKTKTKIILTSIFLSITIIALGIIVFFVLKEYNNPKKRFLTAIYKYVESNSVTKEIINANKIQKNGYNMNLTGNINVKLNEQDFLKLATEYNLINDTSKKELYQNLKLLNNEEQIIDLKALNKDDKIYIDLKDIFEKIYYVESGEIIPPTTTNTDALYKNILKTISEYFTEDKFTKSNETITVNEKTKKAFKVSVSLSDKDISELIILILENILKDESSLKTFTTETLTIDMVKETIQTYITSLKESTTNANTEQIYIYNVYLDGYTILLQELKLDELFIKIEGSESGNFNVSIQDKEYITGTFNQNSININFNYSDITVGINITRQSKIEENQINSSYVINASGNRNDYKVEVNTQINYILNDMISIPEMDLTNAKAFEEMTEEETKKIEENLTKTPLIGEIISSSSGDLTGDTDDYFDDTEINDNYETNEIHYKILDDYNEFNTTINTNKINMIVLGRESCKYCNEYLKVFNEVAKDYNLVIYYIDSDNIENEEYEKIISSNITVPAKCNSDGTTDFKLSEGFGTPLTIFAKNGNIQECISGSTDREELLDKLSSVGLID